MNERAEWKEQNDCTVYITQAGQLQLQQFAREMLKEQDQSGKQLMIKLTSMKFRNGSCNERT